MLRKSEGLVARYIECMTMVWRTATRVIQRCVARKVVELHASVSWIQIVFLPWGNRGAGVDQAESTRLVPHIFTGFELGVRRCWERSCEGGGRENCVEGGVGGR